jgi:cobalt-zinc-cadmium efflux system outer membrane protein
MYFLLKQSRRITAGLLLLIVSVAAFAEPATNDLKTYLLAVLQAQPELKVAVANVAAAQAKATAMSRPVYNPELGIDAQRAQTESYAVGVSQTLDLSGKRSARELSGQKLFAIAEAERAVLQQKIVVDTLKSLADYYGAQIAATLARDRLVLMERFAEIADKQYQAGDIGVLDRDLAVLARAEAIALSGRVELGSLKAQQALNAATRAPGLNPPPLPAAPPGTDQLSVGDESLVKALPSVRLALVKNEAANAEVGVARSLGRADPTIGLRGGREQDRGGPNGEGLIGLQLSIPLFVRNTYRAETAAAQSQADAAKIEADAGYQLAVMRIKSAEGQYRRTYISWLRWNDSATHRIDSGVELLEKVWRVHEISTAEYLVQLKQLLDGRNAGEELRSQCWLSWAEWLDASGEWGTWLDSLGSSSASNTSAATSGN